MLIKTTLEKDEQVTRHIESLRPSKMKAENYEVGTKERRDHTIETTRINQRGFRKTSRCDASEEKLNA